MKLAATPEGSGVWVGFGSAFSTPTGALSSGSSGTPSTARQAIGVATSKAKHSSRVEFDKFESKWRAANCERQMHAYPLWRRSSDTLPARYRAFAASKRATPSADLLTACAYSASRLSVPHARLHRSLCPSPAKTDGEASNPGPVSTAWLDDPDDHFGDEPMPHEEPEDYAFEETCLLNDTALAQTEEYEALQGNAPITPTWMGDSGMDDSVLPRWKRAELWCGLKETASRSKKLPQAPCATMPALKDGVNFVPAAGFIDSAPGWCFKKGGKELDTLGYYRDSLPTAVASQVLRVVISIAARVPNDFCNWQCAQPQPTQQRKRRARRARHPNGSRKKALSRRQRAIRELPDTTSALPEAHGDSCELVPEPFFDEVASVNDERWRHKKGIWALETEGTRTTG